MIHSQRARILKRVVDYINNDDFEEEGFYPFMAETELFTVWTNFAVTSVTTRSSQNS